MNSLLIKFPLDITAEASTNHVINEHHDTSKYANVPYRIVVLEHGYFYSHNISIHDNSGYQLINNVDFQVTGLNTDATRLSGYEVCSVIVIINPRVTHQLYVSAHMVGGEYTAVSTSISRLAETLLNDTRPVDWIRLENKPNKYPTSGHLHALWHFYGFEPFIEKIEEITQAVLSKSTTEVNSILLDLQSRFTDLEGQRDGDTGTLSEHIASTNNPHNTTAVQVGLGNILNYPKASSIDVSAAGTGVRSDRYVTPYTAAAVLSINFGSLLSTHNSNTNNPHQLTASQVNTYTNAEFNSQMQNLLGVGETAIATQRLEGATFGEMFDQVRTQFINPNNVTTGVFRIENLGETDSLPPDYNPTAVILRGDRKWVTSAEILATLGYGPLADNGVDYGVKVVFSIVAFNTNNNLNAIYTYVSVAYADNISYPPGTLVLVRVNTTFSNSGNAGTVTVGASNIVPFYKSELGWVYPTGTPFSQSFYQNDPDAGNQTTTNP